MQKCKFCGKEFEGKFCPACGKKAEENLCPRCNSVVNENLKFCPNCGQELINTAPITAEPAPQPEVNANLQHTVYDDIINKGFNEVWKESNPKANQILRICSYVGWIFLALFIISVIVFIIKLFTITDLIFFTINYNTFLIWAIVAIIFCTLFFLRRDICTFIKDRLIIKWAKQLQNELAHNPYENADKMVFDETSFANLTNKKIDAFRIIVSLSNLAFTLAISIYFFVNINELVNIILGLKLSNEFDVPFSYNFPSLIIPVIFALVSIVLDAIQTFCLDKPITYYQS